MKVNVFGMLISLAAFCAASNLVVLSAAEIPSVEIKTSEEIISTSPSANDIVTSLNSEAAQSSADTENASVEGSDTTDTLPPRLFPTDAKNLSTSNETALAILQSKTSLSVNSTEEVKANETSNASAVENSSENVNASNVVTSAENVSSAPTVSTNKTNETTEDDYDNMSEENEKSDSENIQDNAEQQYELEEEFGRNGSDKATINLFEDPVTNEPAIHSGHFALIFASTLIILSVLAYVGLVLWRGRLEQRYGMRQQLVTEDDYYNNNDVRYFGL